MKKIAVPNPVLSGVLSNIFSSILLGISALSFIQTTQALDVDRAGSWFAGPTFGYYDPSNARDMNNAMMGGLQGGYYFNNLWGAELSAAYFKPNNKTTGESQESYLVNLDGLFALPTHARITPYLAAGVGALKVTETKPEVDFGAGLEVFPADNFSFSGNYRHLIQLGDHGYNDDLFYAGLNFYFGNGDVVHAVPMPAAQPVAQPVVKKPVQETPAQLFREESRYILPAGFPPCKTPAQTGCISLNGNQMSMNLDVKYANDKAVILGAYEPELDNLGKFLNSYSQINLTINGYTSNTGTYTHNLNLSKRRAESVKQYLITHFNLDPHRLSTKGWSWNNPVASNKTAQGQAQNRRVEAVAAVPLKPTVFKVPVSK